MDVQNENDLREPQGQMEDEGNANLNGNESNGEIEFEVNENV